MHFLKQFSEFENLKNCTIGIRIKFSGVPGCNFLFPKKFLYYYCCYNLDCNCSQIVFSNYRSRYNPCSKMNTSYKYTVNYNSVKVALVLQNKSEIGLYLDFDLILKLQILAHQSGRSYTPMHGREEAIHEFKESLANTQ